MAQDPRALIRQSGVIPWRRRGDGIEVLLITSSLSRRWVIPKGLVEPDMSAAESAAKEALEEAGAEGEVGQRLLGTYQYEKWHRTFCVEVYPMRVAELHDEWEEQRRQRAWMGPLEAAERVREPELATMLRDIEAAISG